jgi:uncharacterized protein YkwD
MRNFLFGSLVLWAAVSCSDDKDDEKPSAPPAILAKDPTSIPAEKPKHCLPLPKGWPNPWPCLPAQPKLEPMPASALGEAINKERSAKGLSTVAEDKKLACAATKQASELALRKTCVHTGTDVSSFVERLTKCGFTVNGGAEVIACGHGSPQAAVDALLKSPAHKAILMDKSIKRLGTAQSGNYFVVVFAPN